MSFLHPSKETREVVKLWLDATQVITIVAAIVGAVFTYIWHYDTRLRETRKPWEEKKLAFYTEAARVLARLSVPGNPSDQQEATAQFWELYWGELPFVQSRGPGSVAEAMNDFCKKKFGDDRCSLKPDDKAAPTGSLPFYAITMSQRGSDEIKTDWTK